MKVKDLIKQIKDYPDYEIVGIEVTHDENQCGYAAIQYNHFDIVDVADIGHSDRVVILDLE